MKPFYDGQNAALTLGFLILEHSTKTMDLLLRNNDLDKMQSYEMFLDWLDGQLSGFREHMKLEYFDSDSNEIKKFDKYESAMQHICEKLKEKENCRNDKDDRPKYIYWLNRRAELLASAYESIRLIPERRASDEKWGEGEGKPAPEEQEKASVGELLNTVFQIEDEEAGWEAGDPNGLTQG